VSLVRNVGMMATAGIVAQAVPLALMPILSRIYTPVDLGILALVVSITAVLAPLCTARFELAIMLPQESSDAHAIAGFAIVLAMAVTLVALLLAIVAIPILEAGGKLDGHGIWLYLAPLLAFAIAIGQVGNVLANRRQAYGKIARAGISQQIVNGAVATVTGFVANSPFGLIAARILGAATYSAAFWRDIRDALYGFRRHWNSRDAIRNAGLYRQFALFNMPYSLVGSISRDFLVYAFSAFRDVAAAGQFGLARLLLNAPTSLLAASLSQVFYQQAVTRGGTTAFRQMTVGLLRATAIGFAPACGALALWGPDVFSTVFGEHWREAGFFAAYLAGPLALSALTSWPERIFEANLKQQWSFAIQLTFDALSVGAVVILMANGAEKYVTVLVYACIQTLFHLCYLGAVFHFAGLRLASYFETIVLAAGLFGGMFLAGIGLKHTLALPAAFSVHVAIGTLISLIGLWLTRASYLKQSPI